MSLYTIKAIIVLEATGTRLVSKYFATGNDPLINVKEQESFEKKLKSKTERQNAEVVCIDDCTVVYKIISDVTLCVVGRDENELLLLAVLNTLNDTLDILLNNQIEKQRLVENLDYLLLTIDELVDGGIYLESDPQAIANRVALKGIGDEEDDAVIAEQTVQQVVNVGVDYAKYIWDAFTR